MLGHDAADFRSRHQKLVKATGAFPSTLVVDGSVLNPEPAHVLIGREAWCVIWTSSMISDSFPSACDVHPLAIFVREAPVPWLGIRELS